MRNCECRFVDETYSEVKGQLSPLVHGGCEEACCFVRLYSVGKSSSIYSSGVGQQSAEKREKPSHRVCCRATTALALACLALLSSSCRQRRQYVLPMQGCDGERRGG